MHERALTVEGSELVRGSMSILQKFVCTVIVKQSKRSSGARPSRCCLIKRSYIRLGTGQGQLICARHLQRKLHTPDSQQKRSAIMFDHCNAVAGAVFSHGRGRLCWKGVAGLNSPVHCLHTHRCSSCHNTKWRQLLSPGLMETLQLLQSGT